MQDQASILLGSWDGLLAPEVQMRDLTLLSRFQQAQVWGMDTAIDLFGCNPDTIRDPTLIRGFVIDLCAYIQMRRYGDPMIKRFGDDPSVTGFTLIQLIETSTIAAHFIENGNAACLNIFSCSAYPPYLTAEFCQQWFGAQKVTLSVVFRGQRMIL